MSARRTVAGVLFLVSSLGAEAGPSDRLTLRLRDAPLGDVLFALFELTGQGYVVDADVVGRVDVEMHDVTAEDVEKALVDVGLSFSAPAPIRRVAASGETPFLVLTGKGDPLQLSFRSFVDVRDVLGLVQDVTGDEILAPPGPLGRVALFGKDVPAEDFLAVVLASARLEHRREGARVGVVRPSEPGAPLLRLDAGGRRYGHVPHREGESAGLAKHAGLEGYRAEELTLTGLLHDGVSWRAMVRSPGRPLGLQPGWRLYDGIVESVGPEKVVLRLESGGRVVWRLSPAAAGLHPLPDDAAVVIDRARARTDVRDLDAAEGILRTALDGPRPRSDVRSLRAALADVLYERARVLLARHTVAPAITALEAAYEIDRSDRPWQAAEDLNEIGFAWTSLGEPERAVGPHRQALDLVASGEVGKEPAQFACVRTHSRSTWVEPAALGGLANAERARGRLGEARTLYERALRLWRKRGDVLGESAALTGLGLVHHGLRRYERALALHRQALGKAQPEPEARAAILANVGSAQLALGRRADARTSFESALAIYAVLGDRAGEGTVLNNLGALWEAEGDLGRACAAYAESLAASRAADDRRGEAVTRRHLEHLAAAGRPDEATLSRCREALAESPK